MSKFGKLALLTLAAFLIGFAVSAYAAPPWAAAKDQRVITPYMQYAYHMCSAINTTDAPLSFTVRFCDYYGDCSDVWEEVDVAPGAAGGYGWNIISGYCAFEWYGQRSDLLMTHCAGPTLDDQTCIGVE